MIKYVVIGIIVFIIALVVFLVVNRKKGGESDELTPADFDRYKRSMHPNCSKETFDEFMSFLRKYPGGYYKRRNGRVVFRDYTGREKGDLKGIFYNIVFSNPNINVEDKENFRMFMVGHGVNGCDSRPDYETRDSKLSNRKKTDEEYERKVIGNKGEETVRAYLRNLEFAGYLVINGPVLKYEEQTVEYDHIVIGNNGVFVLETKAFGTSLNGHDKASLFIDKGDKWVLRKNGNNRDLKSPTQQILAEKEHLKGILHSEKEKVDVKPILVLSNRDLFLKNNIELEYDVVLVDDLEKVIENASVNRIVEEEKKMIAQIIDEHRVNA